MLRAFGPEHPILGPNCLPEAFMATADLAGVTDGTIER